MARPSNVYQCIHLGHYSSYVQGHYVPSMISNVTPKIKLYADDVLLYSSINVTGFAQRGCKIHTIINI